MTQTAKRLADRFPNHPEAIAGGVSEAFLDLLGHVHPDQDYSSEVAALLCRYAYDLGRAESAEPTEQYQPLKTTALAQLEVELRREIVGASRVADRDNDPYWRGAGDAYSTVLTAMLPTAIAEAAANV